MSSQKKQGPSGGPKAGDRDDDDREEEEKRNGGVEQHLHQAADDEGTRGGGGGECEPSSKETGEEEENSGKPSAEIAIAKAEAAEEFPDYKDQVRTSPMEELQQQSIAGNPMPLMPAAASAVPDFKDQVWPAQPLPPAAAAAVAQQQREGARLPNVKDQVRGSPLQQPPKPQCQLQQQQEGKQPQPPDMIASAVGIRVEEEVDLASTAPTILAQLAIIQSGDEEDGDEEDRDKGVGNEEDGNNEEDRDEKGSVTDHQTPLPSRRRLVLVGVLSALGLGIIAGAVAAALALRTSSTASPTNSTPVVPTSEPEASNTTLAPTSPPTLIRPSTSGYLTDGNPLDGGFDTISAPNAVYVEVYRTENGLARGILEFDLSGVGASSTFELTVFPGGLPYEDYLIDVYGYGAPEANNELSLIDAIAPGIFLANFFAPQSLGSVETIDVTAFVAARLSAGDTSIGFRFQLEDEGGGARRSCYAWAGGSAVETTPLS